MPAASALNGIEFNIARAVGPALAGVLIATSGVGAAFIVNVASFLGVIVVIARWKRPVHKRTAPPETVGGATVAAIRYVRYASAIRAPILRSGVVMFFASASFALLPTVARDVNHSAIGYGILLGSFGAGAVGGAVVMQPARARWSTEVVASIAVTVLGATMVAIGLVHVLAGLVVVMFVSGAAWIIFISLVSALVQNLAPDWVRARVLAVFMLISQGGMAAGSAVWGGVAARANVETALLWAGFGTIATTALGLMARLPDMTADVSPWNHWRVPAIVKDVAPALEQGPVLVTVEYLETFLVSSWAEHLRQHERSTRGDRDLEDRLHSYARGGPSVRHLIYVESES